MMNHSIEHLKSAYLRCFRNGHVVNSIDANSSLNRRRLIEVRFDLPLIEFFFLKPRIKRFSSEAAVSSPRNRHSVYNESNHGSVINRKNLFFNTLLWLFCRIAIHLQGDKTLGVLLEFNHYSSPRARSSPCSIAGIFGYPRADTELHHRLPSLLKIFSKWIFSC